MTHPRRFWIALGIVGFAATARADGGLIRAQQHAGTCVLTVFTSPTPLRAGPADISVLVQNAETGAALTDEPILIRASNGNPGDSIVAEATSASSTNKLMQSAKLVLPAAGAWTIRVSGAIDGQPIEIEFVAAVEPPLPPWMAFWRLLLLPPAAIGLFAIHRLLVATSARKRP
jgi:hypothetical protein